MNETDYVRYYWLLGVIWEEASYWQSDRDAGRSMRACSEALMDLSSEIFAAEELATGER